MYVVKAAVDDRIVFDVTDVSCKDALKVNCAKNQRGATMAAIHTSWRRVRPAWVGGATSSAASGGCSGWALASLTPIQWMGRNTANNELEM